MTRNHYHLRLSVWWSLFQDHLTYLSVHKHIRAKKTLMYRCCITRHVTQRTSWFCQPLLQISKQQVKIGWRRPEVQKSHTLTPTTQGETSLSIAWCREGWTQSCDFCTLCCELLANQQSSISGSNRLPIGRSNPTLQAMQETSLQQPFMHRSLLQGFLWASHVWLTLCNAFPFPPNADWDFSWSCETLCFIFEKPVGGTWFS